MIPSPAPSVGALSASARLSALLARAAPLARWRALQRGFDQRVARERLLLIAAAAALALMLADSLWLGPALKSFRAPATSRCWPRPPCKACTPKWRGWPTRAASKPRPANSS